jgi:hypothetical protein
MQPGSHRQDTQKRLWNVGCYGFDARAGTLLRGMPGVHPATVKPRSSALYVRKEQLRE